MSRLNSRKKHAIRDLHPDHMMYRTKEDGTRLWSDAAVKFATEVIEKIEERYEFALTKWAEAAVVFD